MEILSIKNPYEEKRMLELCMNLLEKNTLIPVVGSGFTFNTETDNNGRIPSVTELKEKIVNLIKTCAGYTDEELEEIKRKGLPEVSSVFWGVWDRIPNENKRDFFDYIEKNFKNISFFKNYQKNFLNIAWPYIFSLNYDTLIENYNGRKFYAIAPYQRINKLYTDTKTKVYKLHGDVDRFLSEANEKYLILSRDQYVSSLLSDENHDMLDELFTAFSSKSILFYGCGLSEELDILYSAQINLSSKAKNIDNEHQAIIYISFEKGDKINQPFSNLKKDTLERYGVTTIFRISSESEAESFFSKLYDLTANFPKTDIEKQLDDFSVIQYISMAPDDSKCSEFLLKDNLIWRTFEEHKIFLPGYLINRAKLHQAISLINQGQELIFISGNFYSGKTMLLIQIAKHFADRKVFLFPAGKTINDKQLDILLSKENTLLCFDTRALSTAQIREIAKSENLAELRSKRTSILIVIDKSDAPIFKFIFEARNMSRNFSIVSLNSRFDENERNDFNKKIGVLSLLPYNSKETILDYVVKNEKLLHGSGNNDTSFVIPSAKLLKENTRKRITALIMLATEIRLTAKRAHQFDVFDACEELTQICKSSINDINESAVIEKDFTTYNGDSSGFEFVCNSKYWIIKTLSSFAEKDGSIDIIADAYLNIVKTYKKIYANDDFLFYKNSEPYYFFDHIQVLFNQRSLSNSSQLVNMIYDKLLQVLSNSFQFMHQKAKGKLIIAQMQIRKKDMYGARKTLDEAILHISRAKELAKNYPNAAYIDETLLHMTYTEGRVFIERSYLSVKYIPQAVDACYELYQLQGESAYDVYDYAHSAREDRIAFNKFRYNLLSNQTIKSFPDLNKEKVSYLLSIWTGSNIRFQKKKYYKRTN